MLLRACYICILNTIFGTCYISPPRDSLPFLLPEGLRLSALISGSLGLLDVARGSLTPPAPSVAPPPNIGRTSLDSVYLVSGRFRSVAYSLGADGLLPALVGALDVGS
jgi:hypothetical protein